MLARQSANANLASNMKEYVTGSIFQPLVWEQLKAIALTLALAVTGTIASTSQAQAKIAYWLCGMMRFGMRSVSFGWNR